MARFVIQGEWSGYVQRQACIVHVSLTKNVELAAWVKETRAITFDDGTSLSLTVRECKKGERVKTQHGYLSLIEDCFHHKCRTVRGLVELQREAKK